MPDDIEMSAEQDVELSEDELDALFEEEEGAAAAADPTENDDDYSDDEEEPGDEQEDDFAETDDEETDEDEADESDDDEDPLAEIRAQAAALRQREEAAEAASREESSKMSALEAAKAEVLKDLFGQDKVKIGDREVNLNELKEDYGDDLDTLITARAYQIAEPLVQKMFENAGFASQKELLAIKAENDNFRFVSQVAQKHPEVWSLQNDEKFWNWADKQGADIKTLLDKGGVDGVSAVISAYKKATVAATNAKIDKQAGDKLAKHKDLHKSTVRSKPEKRKSTGRRGGALSDEEEAALFNSIELED